MRKFKTIGFGLFIAIALAGSVWGYLHLKNHKKPTADPLQYLPKDAICVIQTNSFKELVNKLTHQNLIWKSLDSTQTVSVIEHHLQYFDSLLSSSENIAAILRNNPLYQAFYKKDQALEQLLVFGLNDYADISLVDLFFEAHFKKQPEMSLPVYAVSVSKQDEWYIIQQGGLVFLSSELGLLQQALSMDKNKSLAADTTYNELKALDNELFCKLYLTNNSGIFNQELVSGHSVFNIEIDPNSANLTGYNKPLQSSPLYALYKQKPGSISCLDYLPKNTVCFTTKIVSNAGLFFEKNITKQGSEQWDVLNDSALYDIRKELEENLDKEFTSVLYTGAEATTEELCLWKIREKDQFENLFNLIGDSSARFQVNSENVKVVRLKTQFVDIFGARLLSHSRPAAFVLDNYLFVFSSLDEALLHLNNISGNEVLSKNPDFMQFANQNLMQQNNFIYYENPELLKKQHLPGLVAWKEFQGKEDKLSHACFTALNSKNALLVRINMQYRQARSMDAGQSYLWVLNVDTVIQTEVFPFKNHTSNENELTFQDARNNLYLVNATGSVLWKKKINEPIRSKIYTVDIFKNNKYQLFFNTDNYLHLVDRNGNYVQGYPVKLPAKVTSDATLFDYDNNKDYRIFVACADHKIYNYTLYGIKNEGFTPVRTNEEVILPVQYIKVAGSDYLVDADKGGNIYIFSRKGEGRVNLNNKATGDVRNFYVDAGKTIQSTKFIYVDDKNNSLCKISLDDKKEVIKLDNDITGYASTFDLVDDDKQMDVIIYGEGGVFAYDLFGSKLMESFSSSAVYDGVIHYEDLSDNVFLAHDKTGAKIDIISPDGKLQRSVSGSTQKPLLYNLFNDNKNYFLVIDGITLKCTK